MKYNYWAVFKDNSSSTFRYDTRIYLSSIDKPNSNDVCIGAVVGKNPGSASALNKESSSLQPIQLQNDKLLPTVKNIINKAISLNEGQIQSGSYIQVLNLFYLCNPNLSEAINSIQKINNHLLDDVEKNHFKWVWYLWGSSDNTLNTFKERFKEIKTSKHIYLDMDSKKIVEKFPENSSRVKHTQGMKHDDIVPPLTKIISTGLL